MKRTCIVFGLAVFGAIALSAQPSPKEAPSTYTLGTDDQILIRILDAEEVAGNTPVRIDGRGNINLAMIGRLRAAGLTTDQLEEEIETRLKKFIQKPDVTVSLTELRSQPISILGSVQTPGVHQLQGRKTLFEVLSLAGGLRPDAGHAVRITRKMQWGPLPLPDAQEDPTGQFSVGSVNVKSIMEGTKPQENIQVKPEDVISVPRAQIVYVIGAVRKSGGFVLGDRETMSALQVLSLSEGFDRFADRARAKIIRPVAGSGERKEIAVDLKKIIEGQAPDVSLQAEDILFIPISGKRAASVRTLETALGMGTSIGTGLVIYRR